MRQSRALAIVGHQLGQPFQVIAQEPVVPLLILDAADEHARALLQKPRDVLPRRQLLGAPGLVHGPALVAVRGASPVAREGAEHHVVGQLDIPARQFGHEVHEGLLHRFARNRLDSQPLAVPVRVFRREVKSGRPIIERLELGEGALRILSLALERAFSRHKAEIKAISGVYRDSVGEKNPAVQRVTGMTRAFAENDGRPPKILVAKMGQDGHDRGQKVIASAFADLGFDVEIGPLFATPEEAAQQAVDGRSHIIGVSSLAAGHLTLVPALKAELEKLGRGDIMIVVGGVIPPQDFQALLDAGAAAIFPPGTVIADAAEKLLDGLNRKLGYAQPKVA